MDKIGFDDWISDQDVEYVLVAKVNDEVAYRRITSDIGNISKDLEHAEEQVMQLLESQYVDGNYDSELQEERFLSNERV